MKILQIGCGNMGLVVAKKFTEKLDCHLTIIEKKNIDIKARIVFSFNEIKDEKFDIIVIAVKPQDFGLIVQNLIKICDKNTVIISIMAAVSTRLIRHKIDNIKSVIRIMPNLGLMKDCGVSLFFADSLEYFSICKSVFGEDGNILITAESDEKLDAITPFTGSSMAYFLLFAKKLAEYSNDHFGIEKSEDICINLLKSTLNLAIEAGIDQGIAAISSKGGITKAACDAMNEDIKNAVKSGMEAGFKRAGEISFD